MNFCTLSDKKYLLHGLALYHSLIENYAGDFKLYWLCLDKETFDELQRLELKNIIPVSLPVLEAIDFNLMRAKQNPASKYGNQHSQYCWALTPYFIDFLLQNFIETDQHLMYIDSDIVFYHSPALIIRTMQNKSIGIHSHRFESRYDVIDNPVGEFNVGVVVFKNNSIGKEAAAWWKDCMINVPNRYYSIYGTCGDQKYLDLFQPLFNDVCVFDRLDCGYLAPWCYDNVQFLHDGNIAYKGMAQPVVFYHFSHFVYDIAKNHWSDSYKGEWNPCRMPQVKRYYENYFEALKNIHSKQLCHA